MTSPRPDALALVPGAGMRGTGVADIRALPGGSVNDLWCVSTASGEFLLRQDGAAWRRPGVNRERERYAHTLAAKAGLAPQILARAPDGSVLVTEFVHGRVWDAADYGDPAQLQRLSALLGEVHRLPLPESGPWAFEPVRQGGDYARLAGENAQTRTLLAEVQAAQQTLEACDAPRVLNHGDALAGNVIEGSQLCLIDWEFAQCADPAWDLGAFAAWSPRAADMLPGLAMAAGMAGPRLETRLVAALQLHRALGMLWYLARGESPPALLASGAASGQTSAPRGPGRARIEDPTCRD